MSMTEVWIAARTLALGALGAGIAWALGFPAPYLTGPAVAVTLSGLFGIQTAVPLLLRSVVFVIIGLSMGQSVTPEVLEAIGHWPLTLAALGASLFAIILFTRLMLVRQWGMDPTTALLSSSPGHLSYVLGLTEGVKADLKTVSIVQSIRVLCLTLIVPVVVTLMGPLPVLSGLPPAETALLPLLACIALAGAAGYGLDRLKLPAAYLIGGLVVSAILHVTGTVAGVVPAPLTLSAFVCMGCLIGTRFSGVTRAELARATGAGLAVTLLAVVLATVFAVIASYATGLELTSVLIAFAPGGVETMAAMSVLLGVDPTFVATHHVARLLMLTFIVPFFVLRRKQA
ncbi:hypothetical protein DFR52_10610 [Hoeflea marina]|uniref:Ammonia monooxygenase n=1 Tax=Hoeflea marina TaxID=274592 RepID=A0A317PIR9_9HYPH|nr:AbrB family transcriptional regulator [Hoeflea marina]PWV97487.1 hypothetical protein DFR52_10610 [Hoeflea marina]